MLRPVTCVRYRPCSFPSSCSSSSPPSTTGVQYFCPRAREDALEACLIIPQTPAIVSHKQGMILVSSSRTTGLLYLAVQFNYFYEYAPILKEEYTDPWNSIVLVLFIRITSARTKYRKQKRNSRGYGYDEITILG